MICSLVSPFFSPIYARFRLFRAFYRFYLRDIVESILARVGLDFAFFWSLFSFPREDYRRPLFFIGSCLIFSSISVSSSLSFLAGQGVEKEEQLEENSLSLNFIYI